MIESAGKISVNCDGHNNGQSGGEPVRWWARIKTVLRSSGTYYAAMAVAGAAGLLKSLGYGLLLVPADFGRLSIVNSFAPFILIGLSRGAIEGVALELPRLYGLHQDGAAAALLLKCVRRLYLECGVAIAVVLIAFATGAPMGILALAVPLAASTGILSLVLTDARSRGDLGRYGRNVLARVICCSFIGLPAAAWFGLRGAVLGEVVAQLILVVWLLRGVTAGIAGVDAGLDRARCIGWKMMVHQMLQMVQQNGDKWLISLALGPAILGQYSFAGIFIVAVSLIHSIVYQQVGPGALRALAEGKAIGPVLASIERVSLAVGFCVAFLAVGTGVAYWIGAGSILAAYREGLSVFPWIALTAVFHAMNHFDWIISTGPRMATLARLDLISTALFFAFGLVGWVWHLPLAYFALLTCVTRAAGLVISVWLARATVRMKAFA